MRKRGNAHKNEIGAVESTVIRDEISPISNVQHIRLKECCIPLSVIIESGAPGNDAKTHKVNRIVLLSIDCMRIRSISVEHTPNSQIVLSPFIIRKIERIQKGFDLDGGTVGQSTGLPEGLIPACEVLSGVVGLRDG